MGADSPATFFLMDLLDHAANAYMSCIEFLSLLDLQCKRGSFAIHGN